MDFLHGEAGRNLDDYQIIASAITRAAKILCRILPAPAV
jgi:hypothetical protein